MAMIRKDGFTEIGTKCQPFEHRVTSEELDDLRSSLVDQFFAEMPKVSRRHEDGNVIIASAKSFQDRMSGETDQRPGTFGAAILRTVQFDDSDYDAWHLRIGHSRTQLARHNNAPQRIMNRLKVEVFNGQVIEAIKEVQVIRGVGELTAEAIEQQMIDDTDDGHIVMQRKSYERYMTSKDCEDAVQFLGRIARRAAVGV